MGYQDDLNSYAFIRNDPVDGTDPTGRRVIFVGGGGDGYGPTDLVLPYEVTFTRDYGSTIPGGVQFYTHYDYSGVRASIEEAARLGQPVVVVGHSWGAATAFKALGDSGVAGRLVTIDPVGGAAHARPSNILAWVNVNLVPTTPNPSDYVEAIGDSIANLVDPNPTIPMDLADVNLTLPGNHAAFQSAMEAALAGKSLGERVASWGGSSCPSAQTLGANRTCGGGVSISP